MKLNIQWKPTFSGASGELIKRRAMSMLTTAQEACSHLRVHTFNFKYYYQETVSRSHQSEVLQGIQCAGCTRFIFLALSQSFNIIYNTRENLSFFTKKEAGLPFI